LYDEETGALWLDSLELMKLSVSDGPKQYRIEVTYEAEEETTQLITLEVPQFSE
jgi:hypothetical protein